VTQLDRCLKTCRANDDCRQGYGCFPLADHAERVCGAGRAGPVVPYEETRRLLGVRCDPQMGEQTDEGRRYTFEFDLSDRAEGFVMAPHVAEGGLQPLELETPERTVDLLTEYRHHNTPRIPAFAPRRLGEIEVASDVEFGWPILVPYAPAFADDLHPGGTYRLTVSADSQTPCLYLLESRGGTKLDLTVHLVGVRDLTAAEAASNPDVTEAIDEMRRIYRAAGLEIGRLRFRDVSEATIRQYQRVNSIEEAQELTGLGRPGASDLAGHRAVDVFLVSDIRQGVNAGSVLGYSASLPGMAGLHGNPRNGVVIAAADLGADNRYVGAIMAHEIGHYIGLRHTTEITRSDNQREQLEALVGANDPIDDTSECDDIFAKLTSDPTACPDFDNLMFPFMPPPSDRTEITLSEGQTAAMRASPLLTE
jgi:hypothetical protein